MKKLTKIFIPVQLSLLEGDNFLQESVAGLLTTKLFLNSAFTKSETKYYLVDVETTSIGDYPELDNIHTGMNKTIDGISIKTDAFLGLKKKLVALFTTVGNVEYELRCFLRFGERKWQYKTEKYTRSGLRSSVNVSRWQPLTEDMDKFVRNITKF